MVIEDIKNSALSAIEKSSSSDSTLLLDKESAPNFPSPFCIQLSNHIQLILIVKDVEILDEISI